MIITNRCMKNILSVMLFSIIALKASGGDDDYYAYLGVVPSASADEIKKAYYAKSFLMHPDKPGGSQEAFTKLSKIYEILSDPSQKAGYDRLHVSRTASSARPSPAGPSRVARNRPEDIQKLRLAAIEGKLDIVRDLITSGMVDVNARDTYNRTALHQVVITGHLGIAQFLISHGADVSIIDNGDRTALNLANINHHSNIEQLLLRHSKSAAPKAAASASTGYSSSYSSSSQPKSGYREEAGPAKKFPCSHVFCDEKVSFDTQKELNEHNFTKHFLPRGRFKCEYDTFPFIWRGGAPCHNLCQLCFDSQNELDEHQKLAGHESRRSYYQ